MHSIQQSFQVPFGYPVHFTTGLLRLQNPLLAQTLDLQAASDKGFTRKLLFVIDDQVAHHHSGLTDFIFAYCDEHDVDRDAVELLILPGGEQVKTEPSHLQRIYEAVNTGRVCRHSFVIAIGGGALLDVAGYAAATAHRGIRIVRVPTTVLSQNDSGVGVKNGVNAFGKKNFLGTFATPHAVLNDSEFLRTLHQRDWIAGTSEAVKVALIRDAQFFEIIEKTAPALVARDIQAMQTLIYRCAQLHVQHIASSGDPFETGSARPLDFGHWAAHKLEQITNFELRHGEAVAIGIALDVVYSNLAGLLPANDLERIIRCLAKLHLPVHHPALGDHQRLLQGLEDFREHLGGELTITLLQAIGKGREVNSIDHSLMRKAIVKLEDHASAYAGA